MVYGKTPQNVPIFVHDLKDHKFGLKELNKKLVRAIFIWNLQKWIDNDSGIDDNDKIDDYYADYDDDDTLGRLMMVDMMRAGKMKAQRWAEDEWRSIPA